MRRIELAAADDFAGFRAAARGLLAAGCPPDMVRWAIAGAGADDLFAAPGDPPAPAIPSGSSPLRISRAFLALAEKAALHSDPARFDLLYRLLWRLRDQPRLLDDAADGDVRRLHDLARAVRRDMHKMRAFVRFRVVSNSDGHDHYVAWFEPDHHIVRANAAFFVNRFTAMRWSILTPRGTVHWTGETLCEGPPASRGDAPAGDPAEDLWKRYYASIFNPARLKIGAMLKEMPRRYWKNMPETALVPGLIAGAQAREAAMIDAGAAGHADPPPASLAQLARQVAACRRCPIGCNGTRAVPGEGPARTPIMLIGEQPGDQEEQVGRPFVGPAGQLLDRALGDCGIDRAALWVTNAVKHFKFTPRGKRRLHQNPTAHEIDTCRWWLDAERALVRPRMIVALGASAARGVLGRTPSVGQVRGQALSIDEMTELWITVHPSYLLRLTGDAQQREQQRFAADLALIAQRVRQLAAI